MTVKPRTPSPQLACPACGSHDWSSIAGTRGGDYLRCGRCRYHLRVTACDDQRTQEFEQGQASFFGADSVYMTGLSADMQSLRARQRVRLISRYLREGSLIEVGPGNGDVLHRFDELGFRVTAVEHSPTMAQLIRDRYGLEVKVGTFEDQDFGEQQYDAFLSFHVIEHVTDVSAHLREAAEIVREGGYAFIATPSADSWEHRLLKSLSPNYSVAHLQLFSRESMTRLLQQAGWEVVDTMTPSYTDAWLRVVSAYWRWARGRPSTGAELVKRSDTPLIRLAIRLLVILDAPFRWLQEALHGGNELVVVARRTGQPIPRVAAERAKQG